MKIGRASLASPRRTFSPASFPTTRTSTPIRARCGASGISTSFMNRTLDGSKRRMLQSRRHAARPHPGGVTPHCRCGGHGRGGAGGVPKVVDRVAVDGPDGHLLVVVEDGLGKDRAGRHDVAVGEDEAPRGVHHKARGLPPPAALAGAGVASVSCSWSLRRLPPLCGRRTCMDVARSVSKEATRLTRIETTAGTHDRSVCSQPSAKARRRSAMLGRLSRSYAVDSWRAPSSVCSVIDSSRTRTLCGCSCERGAAPAAAPGAR